MPKSLYKIALLLLVMSLSFTYAQESPGKITISFDDEHIVDCLHKLAEKSHMNFVFAEEERMDVNITGNFHEMPAGRIIESILKSANCEYQEINDVYVIMGVAPRDTAHIEAEIKYLEKELYLAKLEREMDKLERQIDQEEEAEKREDAANNAEVVIEKEVVIKTEEELEKEAEKALEEELAELEDTIFEYEIVVTVISGFHSGKTYKGSFSYDSSLLTGEGSETITVKTAHFEYEGQKNAFDYTPKVTFQDGEFQNFVVTGGERSKRFGINSGFSRSQFTRNSERFVRDGDSYFGYLDSATYVEGAGTIEYIEK